MTLNMIANFLLLGYMDNMKVFTCNNNTFFFFQTGTPSAYTEQGENCEPGIRMSQSGSTIQAYYSFVNPTVYIYVCI